MRFAEVAKSALVGVTRVTRHAGEVQARNDEWARATIGGMFPVRIAAQCLAAVVFLSACGASKEDLEAAQNDAAKEKQKNAELEKQISAMQTALAQTGNGKAQPTDADEALKAQIADLQQEKAAAEARAKTLDDFVKRFQKLIDAGKLDITIRHGQIVLALATDVLFDAGKTDIKPDGKAALEDIADAIKTVPGRRFQVAGHTDPTPIKTREFPSNWELSTTRAITVVKLLQQHGVRSGALSAAGYAEHDPVGNNASPTGRAKNRRIEIVLLPNIEELVGSKALKDLEEQAKAKEEAKEKEEPKDDPKPAAKPPAGKPSSKGSPPKAPPKGAPPKPKK